MRNIVLQRSPAKALGLLFLILALLFLVKLPFLVVADRDSYPVLFFALTGKKEFSLYYTHSVQKTPVQENFFVDQEDRLLLTSTEYESLGVGTPFLPDEGKLVNQQGKYFLSGLSRHFEEVDLGASPIAGHALIIKNKKYIVNDYFAPNELVRIRVIRCSTAFILWQKIVHRRETVD
ncbi:MAG: hypothetical protein JL50_07985 [Peptococcaceae bacterium BICA1-7]|nr:MAG: hypothetical protein JL50_07985 [Peptococcaceae bacterium BICA1-7]HBV97502.1 DUF1850 domain-containing protein [Desulfotomaculum sp.]